MGEGGEVAVGGEMCVGGHFRLPGGPFFLFLYHSFCFGLKIE